MTSTLKTSFLKTTSSTQLVPLCVTGHIYATRKVVKGQINKNNTVKLRSLRNYCKQDFGLKLSALNWQDVLTSTDVTKAWERFNEYFHSVLDVVASIKEVRLKKELNLG